MTIQFVLNAVNQVLTLRLALLANNSPVIFRLVLPVRTGKTTAGVRTMKFDSTVHVHVSALEHTSSQTHYNEPALINIVVVTYMYEQNDIVMLLLFKMHVDHDQINRMK